MPGKGITGGHSPPYPPTTISKEPNNMGSVQLDSADKKKKKNKSKKTEIQNNAFSEELSITAAAAAATGNGQLQTPKSEKKRKRDESSHAAVSASKAARVSSDANGVPSLKLEPDLLVNPYSVANFRISEVVRKKLKEKGIEALFPIQAQTFDIVVSGEDLVARARTGQGKTLAFVLPTLEVLTSFGITQSQKLPYGRAPSVIVLTPTRELAKQVHADFEFYGRALGLSFTCLYGGAQYGPQENALRRGVDIVVGTPGRIKDHLERGNLNLKTLKFRVLDEADEMLNMGFMEDVELILGSVEDASQVQTLLFSATMPHWVKEISSKFLKATKKIVDLVGEEKMKASASVRHLLLPCAYSARSQIIMDLIRCYSSAGRTIVFTETKNNASELAGALAHDSARALHGDIPQGQREVTLAGFRSGKFNILVATDVAARGLDINDVQLIIQCEPPRDVETYIHRSGRTGRAGKSGVCVTLFDKKKEYMIGLIQKRAGFTFERITPPQPSDIVQASLSSAVECVSEVSDSVVPLFRKAATELIENSDVPAIDVLAKALAKIAGYTNIKRRSLLTSHDDAITLLLRAARNLYSPSMAFNILRTFVPHDKVEEVRRMTLTADRMGAVFDVPSKLVEHFIGDKNSELASARKGEKVTVEIAESLPELVVPPDHDNHNRRIGFSSRGGSSGSRFGQRGSYGGGYSQRSRCFAGGSG